MSVAVLGQVPMAPVLGRGRWGRAAVLVVVALAAVASQALVTPLVSADRGPASAAPTATQGTWPAGLRDAADAAIAADAYRFAPGADGTWATTTPAQGLHTTFGPTGPTVADTIRGGALSLDLARLGRPGALAPVEAAEVVGTADSVEYRRSPSLVEWYRNEARGLEQGFTLVSAPSSGPGPLILEMDATGLAVALSADGSEVVASAPDTGAVLRYSGLEVLDATGRRLPARLAVEGQAVQLRIDDDGAAYPLAIDPWFQQAKLTAADAAGGDRFGVAVAVSGDTAVVGANAADTPAGSNVGSAYVFVRSAGTWALQAKLTAADAAAVDNFGISVAISGDTAVVGAYLDSTPAGSNAGSAYVFVRSAGTWAQQQKLTAADAAAGDRFGISVAVSGDTAVVGAYLDDAPAGMDSGSAYVFVRSAGTWAQQQKLTAADAADGDSFGVSVAVSGDTAVVGAYLDDAPAGTNAGSAYVFVRSAGTWAHQQKLAADDAAAVDNFGMSVAVSVDTAVVGAHLEGGTNAGSAYVFVRSAGTWAQQQKLAASDAAANDNFGASVAVSGDTAVVGAPFDDIAAGTDAGSAYVFVRSAGTWAQQQKLAASDADAGDRFGIAVAVSGDTAVVGAYFDDAPVGPDAGSAYVFLLIKDSPTISTQASAGGPVGTSVAATATVSGGWGPTGEVRFGLFSDATCATQVFTSTTDLVGATATSEAFSPTAPGTYYWSARYLGDAGNEEALSDCRTSVTITEASLTTISTQASAGGLLGTAVTDTATVSGGANPTGDVTFRLFSDADCTAQVFTSTNPLSGGTATSGSFTPASPGTYRWTAVYNGDANNSTVTSPCNAPNESVVITPFQAPAFTRTLTGDDVGPVTVNSGESVLITGARAAGVTVNPGGALTVVNSKISRTVTATAPSFFSMCGTEVSGPPPATALSVTGAQVPIQVGDPATDCAGNRFAGPVVLSNNLAVTFGANAVSHNAILDNNGPGNTVVKANTVFGTLGCTGSNPPPTNAGQVNTAGAKTGQCAGL
jgi:hypothetical protein